MHVSTFSLSTFLSADNCMMWENIENISECYVNLQIIVLAKYNNKNSNLHFNNIDPFEIQNPHFSKDYSAKSRLVFWKNLKKIPPTKVF